MMARTQQVETEAFDQARVTRSLVPALSIVIRKKRQLRSIFVLLVEMIKNRHFLAVISEV